MESFRAVGRPHTVDRNDDKAEFYQFGDQMMGRFEVLIHMRIVRTGINKLYDRIRFGSIKVHWAINVPPNTVSYTHLESYSERNHITLKISYDDGKTWPENKKILLDEYNGRGYSCITSVNENTIGILYESSQADMVFQQIKLEELLP